MFAKMFARKRKTALLCGFIDFNGAGDGNNQEVVESCI